MVGKVVPAASIPSPTGWGLPLGGPLPTSDGEAKGVALSAAAPAGVGVAATHHPCRTLSLPNSASALPEVDAAGCEVGRLPGAGASSESSAAPPAEGSPPREDTSPSAASSLCRAGLGAEQSPRPGTLLPLPSSSQVPAVLPEGPLLTAPQCLHPRSFGSRGGQPPAQAPPHLPSPRPQGSRNRVRPAPRTGPAGRCAGLERYLLPGLRSSSGDLGQVARAWGAPPSLPWEATGAGWSLLGLGVQVPVPAGPAVGAQKTVLLQTRPCARLRPARRPPPRRAP